MSSQRPVSPTPDVVLAKAILKAADQLGLQQDELATTIGLHCTAVSRLKQNPSLDPESKAGELALLLIRIARSLLTLTGGDEAEMRHFMRTPNKLSGGVPAQQIERIQGLVTLLKFVDAMRSRA